MDSIKNLHAILKTFIKVSNFDSVTVNKPIFINKIWLMSVHLPNFYFNVAWTKKKGFWLVFDDGIEVIEENHLVSSILPKVAKILISKIYTVNAVVDLVYFPGVSGTVYHIDDKDRIWVILDKAIMDCEVGVPTPISIAEMKVRR